MYEGPQSSWLGYLTLADRVDIGDYANYIEQVKPSSGIQFVNKIFQNAPVVFTDPEADPKVCAECHRRFSEY